MAALLTFITDIHAIGLKEAQGLLLTTPFYWNRTPESARLVDALLQEPRRDADDGAGGRLFERLALPEGGEGGRHDRAENRRRQDA